MQWSNIFLHIAATVIFTEKSFTVTEPGNVQLTVELIGNVSFDVDITVEVISENSTATGNHIGQQVRADL